MAYALASVIAVSIILPLLALATVLLRFWVRVHLGPHVLGWDDWLAAGAVVLCLGAGANLCVGMRPPHTAFVWY